MISLICGFFKLYFKTILIIFVVIPIVLLIGFGEFSLLVGALAAAPCLIVAIALFGIILFIPLLFVIGFIKALIK